MIVKERAAMNWMFLDAPEDGTVMLVWQPLNQLGTQSATDGYIWADAEQAFSSEVRGYVGIHRPLVYDDYMLTLSLQTVEMYVHRSGYHPPNETIATHARRRYRLTPARIPNPSLPPCDPALWIVHYSRAEPQYHLPANRIPLNPQVSSAVTERRFLQQHGQLVRKEFMLRDHNNWPTINLPSTGYQASGYPGNVISHLNRNQSQSYMPPGAGGHVGPSPSKRPRHAHAVAPPTSIAAATMVQAQDAAINEEEDTSRGDLMDFLTPKDISTTRYTQHHEWLEEVFSSPYTTGQIIPVPLGLGRKGELEALTKEFFDAPTTGTPSPDSGPVPVPLRVGRMEVGKAEDFTKRATEKVAEINAEMEKLKRQHARRMAKVKKGGAIREAEQNLRLAALTLDHGDSWTLEEQTRSPTTGVAAGSNVGEQGKVDDTIAKVEKEVGRNIVAVKEMECIQKGGLEEKGQIIDDKLQDFDLGDHSADLSRQPSQAASYHLPNDPPSIGHISSMGHTPQFSYDGAADMDGASKETPGVMDGDATMVEIPHEPETQDTEAGDWIMVDKEGESTPQNAEIPDLDNLVNDSAMEGTDLAANDTLNTADDALQGFTPDVHDTTADFATNDFSDAVDFSNLDTAGEALSGYGEGNESMGLDENGNLGLEDSAFGDAFGDAGTGTGTGDDNELPAP